MSLPARLVIAGLMTVSSAADLAPARASPAPSMPATGTEVSVVIDTLKERLLSADSATAVLEAWCAEHGLSDTPRLFAERLPGPDKPLTLSQRLRLRIGTDEPVRYRRVRLVCGSSVLSEADNWYVPARLTPEMNRELETTDVPFGRVVRTLAPSRRNLYATEIWTPAAAVPAPADPLFSVAAVLSTREGMPFCEVSETYTGAVLARGRS